MAFSGRIIKDVWERTTEKIRGKNPDVWRRDECGNVIKRGSYGTHGKFGWEIDHRKPRSKGGTDHLHNLRALHWRACRARDNKTIFIISSSKDIDTAWGQASSIRGENPDVWRKDENGNIIRRGSYGTLGGFGWEIDHRKPKSKGDTDDLRNLQALSWRSNRTEGGTETPKHDAGLSSSNETAKVYRPKSPYTYFVQIKKIIARAKSEIFLIDPYFDGETFDLYFGSMNPKLSLRLLVAKNANDLKGYAKKHIDEYGSQIELRCNKKELHDRLLLIDQESCWITGGSFQDGGEKASYIVPFHPELSAIKYNIYQEIWDHSADMLKV